MYNYLKKMLLTLLILGMPCMNSVSKAMDMEDYEGSSVRARNVNFVTEDQKDISSSVKQSVSSQVVSLEDSKVSWGVYLSSPIKSVFQGAYEIMDFAIKRPKLAIVVGITYILPTLVVAQNCCVITYPTEEGCEFSRYTTNKTCPETSSACKFHGCYIARAAWGGCTLFYNKGTSVSVYPGACTP